MSNFCILIPTIDRKDLLVQALDHYEKAYPNTRIIVVDNGNQELSSSNPNLTILGFPEPMSIARSWNCLILYACYFGETNFLILNDDVILQKDENTIKKIIKKSKDNTFQVCRPSHNWSSFLLTKSVYDRVGKFDEDFEKSYFQDNDYAYRMKLAGVKIKYEDDLNPDVYPNIQTTLKDTLLNNYIDSRDLFIKKWGGMPNEEAYTIPYNKEEQGISEAVVISIDTNTK